MSEEERVAIEKVLPNMGLHPLPDNWTPIEAFALIKVLDEDGDSTWCYRTTAVPNRHELLGALMVHVDLLKQELVDEWEKDE